MSTKTATSNAGLQLVGDSGARAVEFILEFKRETLGSEDGVKKVIYAAYTTLDPPSIGKACFMIRTGIRGGFTRICFVAGRCFVACEALREKVTAGPS